MLIGISGKKQAGKDTITNFVKNYINNTQLVHTYKLHDGTDWAEQYVVRTHSFADLLKRNVCIDIFGLTEQQCYGTDEDKNTYTDIEWKDIRSILSNAGYHINEHGVGTWKTGFLTAREVLQIVGTDIFRAICPDIWVKASLRKITDSPTVINIFTDCRFPNEVYGIKNKGGQVYRLTRNPLNDNHKSELALDPDKFDWYNFIVIDNEHLTENEQGKILVRYVLENLRCQS